MPNQNLLHISDLHVSVEAKPILNGVALRIAAGEIHAIMGPNGSGKSTLVSTLMGHPKYKVTKGKVTFRGKDLLAMTPDARARAGLFLAFQYPREIAGVTLRSFLFAAHNAQAAAREKKFRKLSPIKFKKLLEEKMQELKMDTAFAERFVNQGWSGGEKKKAEILQLKVLYPLLALLDETDSGLDIDALKIVADGINSLRFQHSTKQSDADTRNQKLKTRNQQPFSAVLVTHYARILGYITPDRVHVMVGGRIVESGGEALARRLEKEGYEKYGVREGSALNVPLEM